MVSFTFSLIQQSKVDVGKMQLEGASSQGTTWRILSSFVENLESIRIFCLKAMILVWNCSILALALGEQKYLYISEIFFLYIEEDL